MSWTKNTLYTVNPSVEVTIGTTDRWSVDFAPALKVGESLSSAAVTIEQIDPASHAAIVGFAGSATVASNAAVFDITGSSLVAGKTYLMKTAGTLNTGKVVVLLTAVICVA